MIDHLSTHATNYEATRAFYEAALGAPGPRPICHEHYYGAFVLDPDGNNKEAVCRLPE